MRSVQGRGERGGGMPCVARGQVWGRGGVGWGVRRVLWRVACLAVLFGFFCPVVPALGQGTIVRARVQILAPDPADPQRVVTIYDDKGDNGYVAQEVTSVFPLYLAVRLASEEPTENTGGSDALPKSADGTVYNLSIGGPGKLCQDNGEFYVHNERIQSSEADHLKASKFRRWVAYAPNSLPGQAYTGQQVYVYTYPAVYLGMAMPVADNASVLGKLLDAHEAGSSYCYQGTDPVSQVRRTAHVVRGEYRLLDGSGVSVKKDWTSFFEWAQDYSYCTAVLPATIPWDYFRPNETLFASRKLLTSQPGVSSFDFAGITGDVTLELRFTLGDRPEQRVDFLSNGAGSSRVLILSPDVQFNAQAGMNFSAEDTKVSEVPVWRAIKDEDHGAVVVDPEMSGYHFLLGTYLAIEKPADPPADWGVFLGGWPELGGGGGVRATHEVTLYGDTYVIFPVEHRDGVWPIAVGTPPKLYRVTFGPGVGITTREGATVTSGQGVAENSELLVKVTPPPCQQVDAVNAGTQPLVVGSDGLYHHVLTADVKIEASFSMRKIALTPPATTGYTVSYDQPAVDCGSSLQVTVTPVNPLAVLKHLRVTFAPGAPGGTPREETPQPTETPGAQTFTLGDVENAVEKVEATFAGPYTLGFEGTQGGQFELKLLPPPADRVKELSPTGSSSKSYEVTDGTELILRVEEKGQCHEVDKVQYEAGGASHEGILQPVADENCYTLLLPAMKEDIAAVRVIGKSRELTLPAAVDGAERVTYSPTVPACGGDVEISLVPRAHEGLEEVVVAFRRAGSWPQRPSMKRTTLTGLVKGADGSYTLKVENLQESIESIRVVPYAWPRVTVSPVSGYTLELKANGAALPADGYVDKNSVLDITVEKDASDACLDAAQYVLVNGVEQALTGSACTYQVDKDVELAVKPEVRQYTVSYDAAAVTVLGRGHAGVPSGGHVACGTQLQLEPKIADECQEFEHFAITGGATATLNSKTTVDGVEGYWYEVKAAVTIGVVTKTKQLTVTWTDDHVRAVESGGVALTSGGTLACGSPLKVTFQGEAEREILGLLLSYADGTKESIEASHLTPPSGTIPGSYTLAGLKKSIVSIEVQLSAPPTRYRVVYSAPGASEATVRVEYGAVKTTPGGIVEAGGTQVREGAEITIIAESANPQKHSVVVKLTMGGATIVLPPDPDGNCRFKLTGEATLSIELALRQYRVEYVAKNSNRELTVRLGSSGGAEVMPGGMVNYGARLYVSVKALVGEVRKVIYRVQGSSQPEDAVVDNGGYSIVVEGDIASIDCQVGSCTQYTVSLQETVQGELRPGTPGQVATAALLQEDGTPVTGMVEQSRGAELWATKEGMQPGTRVGVKLDGLRAGWHAVGLTANDMLVSTTREHYFFTLPGATPRKGCAVDVKVLANRDLQVRPEEYCYLWVMVDDPLAGEVSVVFEGETLVPYGGYAPVPRGRRVQIVAQSALGYEVQEATIGGEREPDLALTGMCNYVVPLDPQVTVVQVWVRFTPVPPRYSVRVDAGMHATYTVADAAMAQRIKMGKPVLAGALLDLTVKAKEGFYLRELLCNDTTVYAPTDPQHRESTYRYRVAVTRPLQLVVRTGQLSVLPVEDGFRTGVKCYPNPTTGALTLEGVEQVESYRLLDAQGRVVRVGHFGYLQGQQMLDMHGLPCGLYFLLLRSTGGVEVPLRVVVQRPMSGF